MTTQAHQWTIAMPWLCATLCIVAGEPASSTRAQDQVGLSTIASWDFSKDEDVQADLWPDGWSRRRDVDHPGFIPVQIDKKAVSGINSASVEYLRRWLAQLYLAWKTNQSPWGIIPETIPAPVEKFVEQLLVNPYLRVDMDGGSVEVYSPKIPVDDSSLYGLQVDVRGDSDDFAPGARLRFLDRSGKLLFETEASRVRRGRSWRTIRTPGSYNAPSGVSAIQAALTVRPQGAVATRGVYGFDRLRIVQMPKTRLQLDRATRIYRPGESIVIRMDASGLKQSATRVDMSLVDHEGQEVLQQSRELQRDSSGPVATNDAAQAAQGWEGGCSWKLKGLPPGYYEVVTRLKRSDIAFYQNRESFAVVPQTANPSLEPRFGWSLDERVLAWNIEQLSALVEEGGVGYVKIPIWFDPDVPEQQETLQQVIDRFQAVGIQCVGVIHEPIGSSAPRRTDSASLDPMLALHDPNQWKSKLEPVFRAMCTRLVHFQIGRDQDSHYGSNAGFVELLTWTKDILRRYGSEPTLTIARNPWVNPPRALPIDRWQWALSDPVSDAEWPFVMVEAKVRSPDWTSVTPASSEKYSLSTRTKDLAARMIAAIRLWDGRSSTSWVSLPFEDPSGFLAPNGAPREMFLPFRILLDAIKKRDYVGEMILEGGSRNALLSSGSDSCLILWSTTPTTEQLFLGDRIEAIDVWGRKVNIDRVDTPFGPEHQIHLGKWPVLIRGVDPQIALWRAGLAMEQKRLDSLIGQRQRLNVRFNNPFPNRVSGRIDLVVPGILDKESDFSMFDAEPYSESNVPIDVLLRPDATAQDAPARIVVSLNTSPPKRFSVGDTLRIGNDEVEFETIYRFSDNGELWLDIEAINHTSLPVSFDCQLFIPNRRNERIQFNGVENRRSKTVVIPQANQLMHESLWLRCVQLGTRRVLNYRIAIEPPSGDSADTAHRASP